MKVFEIILEAQEDLTEHSAPLNIGSFQIQVDPHSIDRAQERHIDPDLVDILLRRVPNIKAKIKTLNNGQNFWLYSKKLDLSLGLKIINSEKRILRLKTVIPGAAWADYTPTIEVFE